VWVGVGAGAGVGVGAGVYMCVHLCLFVYVGMFVRVCVCVCMCTLLCCVSVYRIASMSEARWQRRGLTEMLGQGWCGQVPLKWEGSHRLGRVLQNAGCRSEPAARVPSFLSTAQHFLVVICFQSC
jgi:hypothetical protein